MGSTPILVSIAPFIGKSMSKSFKKNPYVGNTTAESEKQDKRLNNRRLRRQTRQAIQKCQYDALPMLKDVSNPYGMDKDGKHRFDPIEFPEQLRK